MTSQLKVARASLHMWEEPALVGRQGSGTIFFSGCNLACVYCQNQPISQGGVGQELSLLDLVEVMLKLQALGAANLNLVTGVHYIPHLRAALSLAKGRGLTIPVVYNSSAYEDPAALRSLEGLIDIYLPDLRYWREESGRRYSGIPSYPTHARAAIQEMFRQVGPCRFQPPEDNGEAEGEEELLAQGLICRQLLLPGLLDEAQQITHYLYTHYGDQIYLSLMSQYTPLPGLEAYPELQTCVDPQVYEAWLDYAEDLGVKNAYVQEGSAASESFIPDFYHWNLSSFLDA